MYLSGRDVAANKGILTENKITHVINVAFDLCDNPFENELKYLSFMLKDHPSEVSLSLLLIRTSNAYSMSALNL